MLNFARGIMYTGAGLAFGGFALFIVTISNSWTERMTETLILWVGILTGSIVLTAIIVVVYRVTGNRQNGDEYYDDAPSRRSSRSTALAPMGGGNGQPSIIFVQPNGAGGRQDAIYGYGQQQALPPPPQGSFDYSAARYELEF